MKLFIAQLIGMIGFIMLVISYYRKDTDHILAVQIIASIFFVIHYFLLEAYVGLAVCMINVIIDILYYKTDLDNKIFRYSVPFYILVGYLGYNHYIDVLTILACLIDGFALTKRKKYVLYGSLIAYSLWIIYDIYVFSIPSILSDFIIVLSNLYILSNKKDLTIH